MSKSPARMDLPQGTLDLVVLQVVAGGSIHGYGIAQRIKRASRDALQVPQGSLYPALHRLERQKLLVAEWKPSDTGAPRGSTDSRPAVAPGCRSGPRGGSALPRRSA